MRYFGRVALLAVFLQMPLLMGAQTANDQLIFNKYFKFEVKAIDDSTIELSIVVRPRLVRPDDYFFLSYVTIIDEDGNVLDEVLSDPHPIVPLSSKLNPGGLIHVVPQFVPWDSRGHAGLVGVSVISQVFDANGTALRNGSNEVFEVVEIRSGECSTTDSTVFAEKIELNQPRIDPDEIEWIPSGSYFGSRGVAVIEESAERDGQ